VINRRLEISLYPAENGIVCFCDDYSDQKTPEMRYCAKDLDDALAWIAKTAKRVEVKRVPK
jgi:hypothetical protein